MRKLMREIKGRTMYRSMRNRLRAGWAIAFFGAISLAGCDFLDPTEVDNPATTDDDLADSEEPTAALLPGLRAQFARAINPVEPEVISDNYQIRGTGIDKLLDNPRAVTPDLLGARAYGNLQELRALADFVLEGIVPDDTTATQNQIGEARYYRGMAYLMMGERFVAVPTDTNGVPVTSADLIQRAITELISARSVADADFALASTAALARAYRVAGNVSDAVTEANAILAADPEYVSYQDYDPSTITNGPYLFLFERVIKEMQPLPRLDFLDPKYTGREAPIYLGKAEEIHLILAEAAFSQGTWDVGREEIALAIELVATRPSEDFDDDDPRLNDDLTERPHDASIEVRADATSPYRAGLVLSRPGVVTTPTVSATSLDADSIRAIPVGETESLLHALFLARQEMLLLEGRRMTDLGIRMPVESAEIETNLNISEGDPGTSVFVPSYIPAQDEMDLFSPASPYDADGNLVETQITCQWDMNRVLAQNWTSFGRIGS
jgi:tetratricopeptide (TPR) repeat protein